MTGTAHKGDFPETRSLTTAATSRAAFVVKLNGDGQRVYSVLVGGADSVGRAIAVDGNGNAYVTGTTTSADFPTTAGAYDRTFNGEESGEADTFVFKLDAAGTALSYSTYLGGTGTEESAAIVLDSTSNAYVAGSTSSTDFPTTPAAFQPAPGLPPPELRAWDAFLTKLNSTGTALVYSSYAGGNSLDYGRAVAVGEGGEAYLAIRTHSNDLPVTAGAAQTYQGMFDAYVVKLDATGSAPIYSTYLGGRDFDEVGGIAVNADGHVLVTGTTQIWFFPVTPGAVLTNKENSDFSDVYLTELNNAGELVYSTYLGGGGNDIGVAVAVGANDDAYVTGGGDIDLAYTPGTVTTPGMVTPFPNEAPIRPFATRLVPRISRTKSASASSQASSSFAPAAAVDANFNTRWVSAANDTQWLLVDLGERVNVDRVVVHWAADTFARYYEIQVSGDLSTWQPLFVGASDGGIDDARGAAQGRYVRIYCTQRNNASGYSIWEVDVYGQPVDPPNQAPTATITSPADGWTFMGPTTFDIVVEAGDTDSTIEKVDFFIDDNLVVTDTVSPYVYAATLEKATGSSTIHVVAYDDRGASSASTPQNSITVHHQPLPASWSSSDVGNTGRAGLARAVDDTIVLAAGGADVWGTADGFYFIRRTLSGDGDVIARVDAIEKPADALFALAGVMFRESLAAGSRHAAMVITSQGKAKFRRRLVKDGHTRSDGPRAGALPVPRWVKISRRGNVFTASISTDGVLWTEVHPGETIAMPRTLEVGFFALRQGGTGAATASLTEVSVAAAR